MGFCYSKKKIDQIWHVKMVFYLVLIIKKNIGIIARAHTQRLSRFEISQKYKSENAIQYVY